MEDLARNIDVLLHVVKERRGGPVIEAVWPHATELRYKGHA